MLEPCLIAALHFSIGVITARYALEPQTSIGIWLHDDVQLWWKGLQISEEVPVDKFF